MFNNYRPDSDRYNNIKAQRYSLDFSIFNKVDNWPKSSANVRTV